MSSGELRYSSDLRIIVGEKRHRLSSVFTPKTNYKVFKFGERGCGLKPRGEVQDFHELRQECLDSGLLYEDEEFGADSSSIFFSETPTRIVEWRRPRDIVDDPQLFVEGATRFDVRQGELGDCWLLAAIANLTLSKKLFNQIVPSDQGFGNDYAGIFYFRFWQYGKWIDVVVDDRLPTYNNRLVFMHSSEKNEFWSALLEKAYAKLHGSYEALKGGTTCEAMEDFTGGVSESFDLRNSPPDLFTFMSKGHERGSLMACSIEPDPYQFEAKCPNGLIKAHAYSVTGIKVCDMESWGIFRKSVSLVRIRNPWGNEMEWKGAWSDQSEEWSNISPRDRDAMGLTFDHDGEFWMSLEDFLANFTLLELTNLADSLNLSNTGEGKSPLHSWEINTFEGAWVRGVTAGGCRNNLTSFWRNPQFIVTLSEADDGDNDNKCTVIVALMQKNRRAQRRLGLDCLNIGFAIYQIHDPERGPRPLDFNFFRYNVSVAKPAAFINKREVSGRFKLPPGTYCIVPSTFSPNEEGEFLLRVFTEKKSEMMENDDDTGHCKIDDKLKTKDDEKKSDANELLKEKFQKVAGADGEIDCRELRDILDFTLMREFTFDGFSKDASRSLIALMDVDRSGKLCFQEFISLWKNIRLWKNVFKTYDADASGRLQGFEVRDALHSAGYSLNTRLLNTLTRRFGDKEGNVTFDDFILCCTKLKTLIETFESHDRDRSGRATFSLDHFLESAMYS